MLETYGVTQHLMLEKVLYCASFSPFSVLCVYFPFVCGSCSSKRHSFFLPFNQGYKQQHAFIVTQYPLKSTLTDFWRMLCEHDSSCVVLFHADEEEGVWFRTALCLLRSFFFF